MNEQQQEKLGTILRPLHDKIKDFEEQVRKAYETEGKERHLLKSEVAKLVEQNQRLSKDADNLTKALKGDSQAQGAWGEMLLEKLLDSSGLVKGQEYSMQESSYACRWLSIASRCGDHAAGGEALDHRLESFAAALRALSPPTPTRPSGTSC